MKKAVILIGVGEMGGVFARGFLKSGHPVYSLMRGQSPNTFKETAPDPEAVIVAVGEKDLHAVLQTVPQDWHDRLVLLQNELLPKDWQQHNIPNPTVISVWFEKKPGQDAKVIIPSPVFGPKADLVKEALESINISVSVLNTEDELLNELVVKNLYILTSNVSGLVLGGGTVGELWSKHNELAREIADNVLDIQFAMINKELDRASLIDAMVKAFDGDLDHKCMGRSAPARLERAVAQADEFEVGVKKLREIQQTQKAKA